MSKQIWFFILFWGIGGLFFGMNNSDITAEENYSYKVKGSSQYKIYSSLIEKQIRSGAISTAELIASHHPRLWAFGEDEWDFNKIGTVAWRIVHGTPMSDEDLAYDQEKREFYYCASIADDPECYGVTDGGTFGRRFLWTILAGHARRYGWENQLPSSLLPWSSATYNPKHTDDEYYADARAKLLGLANISLYYEWPYFICIYGSIGYDWLVNLKYNNGNPVLSGNDKTTIQQLLITNADHIKQHAGGEGKLFASTDIANYVYCIVGMALYEPSRINEPNYATVNAKANTYLNDFDTYWVGKILPALNAQGGDGGWHGGFEKITQFMDPYYSDGTVLTWHVAPILFAHYTATGAPIEESIFSTGVIKYGAEFQNFMIRPNNNYYPPIPDYYSRMPWIAPMRMYSRRRFSSDPEQKKIGELGAWIRGVKSPDWFVNAGSYDFFEQTIFEEKWVNPRSPEEIGYSTTRAFQQLGWVFMRSGFTNSDDLAAIFICQRYHWSTLNTYSQNSFTLERKGELIQGYQNTIKIDGQGQRSISNFPTVSDGVEAYAPGSQYDVGPGILKFVSNNSFDYMFGDATNAYDSNKLEKFTRQIVYLKPDIFVIFDRVVTKNANSEKSWIIDPGATPQSISSNLIVIENGSGALWLNRLLPENVINKSITTDRYEVVPDQFSNEDFFLNVMQTTDSDLSKDSPEVIADDATLLIQGDKIGVRVGTWEVLFKTDGDTVIWVNGQSTPVLLSLFEATIINSAVQLIWQTASEINNFGFEIERSLNNKHFQKIGFVRGHGTSEVQQNYHFSDEMVEDGKCYYYRLKQLNTNGTFEYSSIVEISKRVPGQFNLQQNYPNPCNPSTIICYSLPNKININLTIFDTQGRHIITLVQEKQSVGKKHVVWNGKDKNGLNVSNGLYFYRLKAGDLFITKKMLLIR